MSIQHSTTRLFICRIKKVVIFVLLLVGYPIVTSAQSSHQLKVGVYDNPPKIFVNEKGNPDGIFIDVLKSVTAHEVITVEYITGKWSELYQMLLQGEIDVLPDMAYSRERDSLFTLSVPVLSSWLQVFTTSESIINKIDDLNNKRIGVLKASSQEEFVKKTIKNNFQIEYRVFSFDTYSQSVQALKNNHFDALIADRFFYFSELCDQEILPSGVILQNSTLHFAFSKKAVPELIEFFNKNLTLLYNNPKSDFYLSLQKWFNKHRTILPDNIKWLIAGLSICVFIFLLFTVVLRERVKARTKSLEEKNQELLVAKVKADESNQLKTAFLRNIYHEIRTPMNGIMGFINLLNNKKLSEEDKQQYIEIINSSSERLLNTINDIIEIARIESNQVEVNPSEVNVVALMDEQFNDFVNKALNKGLKLEYKQQLSTEDAIITTDEKMLKSIFTILLNNAIKFTNKGYIELGSYKEDKNLFFYVRDTGIGIPSDRLTTIFERFVYHDLQLTRPYDGSGLGLAIVKAYLEMLNGTIWVESEPDKGSVFYFKLLRDR